MLRCLCHISLQAKWKSYIINTRLKIVLFIYPLHWIQFKIFLNLNFQILPPPHRALSAAAAGWPFSCQTCQDQQEMSLFSFLFSVITTASTHNASTSQWACVLKNASFHEFNMMTIMRFLSQSPAEKNKTQMLDSELLILHSGTFTLFSLSNQYSHLQLSVLDLSSVSEDICHIVTWKGPCW